ncbi:MAG TPA: PilN domain-containing protein, partial [Planctomycetota bacterium]|nr:PilN domain-containing protein [Planctomycetota bacterium]
ILRQFRVPVGGAEETAAMVRFQLEKELPVPVGDTRYVYHELESKDGKTEIVAICVPRASTDAVVGALEDIGVKVGSVVLGTMGLANLAPGGDGAVALEFTFDESMEILVWAPGRVLVSQSGSVQGMDAVGRADLLSRMLNSFQERGETISKLILTRDLPGLAERLGSSIQVEVADLKSLLRGDDRVPPAEVAPLIGAAIGIAAHSPSLKNLLAPAITKKRSKAVTFARAASLLAVVLVGLVVWLRFEISDLNAQIEEVKGEIAKSRDVPKKLKEVKAREADALQWAESRPRWIDVLADLSDLVDTKKLFLSTVDFDTQGGATLVGRAKRKQDASDLVLKLNTSKRFNDAMLVIAQESRDEGKGGKGEAADYPVNFTVKAKVGPGSQVR